MADEWTPAASKTNPQNLPWLIAAAGLGVLLLAALVDYLMGMDNAMRGSNLDVWVPYVLQGLGKIAACGGLVYLAAMGQGLSNAIRAVLLVAAAVLLFALVGVRLI